MAEKKKTRYSFDDMPKKTAPKPTSAPSRKTIGGKSPPKKKKAAAKQEAAKKAAPAKKDWIQRQQDEVMRQRRIKEKKQGA